MIIPEFNCIKWRCRRGMLEIDLLLNGFVDNNLGKLNQAQIDCMQQLLLEDDPSLEKWLLKNPEITPAKYQEICQMIMSNVSI